MIESRKEDHMDICMEKDVSAGEDYWDMIKFFHRAAPEIDMDDISTELTFLGKKISAPFVISAITGGYEGAININDRISSAGEELNIPIGVGSQRPAIENKKLRDSYEVVARYDIPLVFGNIGAPQLIEQKNGKDPFDVEDCREALDMIDGDFLAVHFNFLQEVIQPEGDDRAKGLLEILARIAKEIPLIAKETGAGISYEMALEFKKTGVEAIDVGGMGGTSFSAVEYYRTKNQDQKELAGLLWDWGIPTPVSIIECRRAVDLPLISTGGIKNGLQAAKALALGADIVGIAGGVLPAANRSKDDIVSYINKVIKELKVVMFLLGCKDLNELKRSRLLLTGELRDWLDQVQ